MMKQNRLSKRFSARDLVLMGLMAALLAVCSWISVPAPVPFTLQTFAVFLTLLMLPAGKGTLTILAYLLLGAAGLPVFSGFRGGIAALLGPTGGYLTGFLLTGLCCAAAERLGVRSTAGKLPVLAAGLLLCYGAGTIWFVRTYTGGEMTVSRALGLCVWPFLLPDAGKLLLAAVIAGRVRKALRA